MLARQTVTARRSEQRQTNWFLYWRHVVVVFELVDCGVCNVSFGLKQRRWTDRDRDESFAA